MKHFICIMTIIISLSLNANAQWKAGITMGGISNTYSIDTQYQYDWRYGKRNGFSFGLTGQYSFNEWFALRADLNYTQKGYKQYRTHNFNANNYNYRNNYLQLPVMASFSFGGKQLRGFTNLGFYGGYWLNSYVKGTTDNLITSNNIIYKFDEKVKFNSQRDNRIALGYVAGIGMEYVFAKNWSAQLECRYYYDVTSTTKQYMRIKDYRYNTTLGIQAAVLYNF